ncbi:endonuclease III domain-containing protein [Aestuariimicrobium sp. Y1814]|uniref:endonuclease III domain-containing protein n=1 Tax=Aestuariimicrobium sp. Y1814 TaxID=3418742 RepID=UPI003DA75ECA
MVTDDPRRGDKLTVWDMMARAAAELREPFSRQDVLAWFARRYPEVPQGTVSAQLQFATSNAPEESRGYFASRTPLVTRIGRGRYVRYRGDPATDSQPSSVGDIDEQDPAPSPLPSSREGATPMAPGLRDDQFDIVLVSCGRAKRPTPSRAADLYTSWGFAHRRTLAEALGRQWFILSADHGLVMPDEWLAPYDVALAGCSSEYRREWGRWVAARLIKVSGGLRGRRVLVLGPAAYAEAVRVPLGDAGAILSTPLAGMRQGEQGAWLSAEVARRGLGMASPPRVPTGEGISGEAMRTGAVIRTREAIRTGETVRTGDAAGAQAVVQALLDYRRSHYERSAESPLGFAHTRQADDLLRANPFAFLIGVVFDHGIRAERAWEAPMDLIRRLGTLDPSWLSSHPREVAAAIAQPPALHRFTDIMATATVAAAELVCRKYRGDAGRLWAPGSTAAEVDARFREFPWVGPKKAAMAVELLVSRFGVELRALEGTDVAYDVHVRRVFLRTGLVNEDSLAAVTAAARRLNPERPGLLDGPTWSVGRDWCHRTAPDCPACPLTTVCPKLVHRNV